MQGFKLSSIIENKIVQFKKVVFIFLKFYAHYSSNKKNQVRGRSWNFGQQRVLSRKVATYGRYS